MVVAGDSKCGKRRVIARPGKSRFDIGGHTPRFGEAGGCSRPKIDEYGIKNMRASVVKGNLQSRGNQNCPIKFGTS
jgi:hypothetical protein